jgi:site-specific DNA recombinase
MNPSPPPDLRAALYARVSGDRQAHEGTIASQVDALKQRALADGCPVAEALCFTDDGHSGSTLWRPALERLRDQIATGAIDRLYVYSPDRLSRNFAHQAVLLEEFQKKGGVEVVFCNRPPGRGREGHSPEDELLLQVQAIIAEYERAQICERCRRGKVHAARLGRVSVLGHAPYGYRYVNKHEGGGQARYEIVLEQARVVRQIFAWVAQEQLSLAEVSRRLTQQGVPTPGGRSCWCSNTVAALLRNPAYQGTAGYGKTRVVPLKPRLRPLRGHPGLPRHPRSITRLDTNPIAIAVPALVSAEDFAAAAEQLAENRRRLRLGRAQARYLLQGLVVCQQCGYAWHGLTRRARRQGPVYSYYRCGGQHDSQTAEGRCCRVRQVRCATLDEAIWQDVCGLLRHPQKVEEEYHRRLLQGETSDPQAAAQPLARLIEAARRMLSRLIDAYSEGLLSKEEFAPRLEAARQRLQRLEAEARDQAAAAARQVELRLALRCLQDFAVQVHQGLEKADGTTQREIIRALVKRVEVGPNEVRIVYRVAPVPFVEAPNGGTLQDRRESHQS